MTKSLFIEAMIKILSGVILMGLLLFAPAGTLDYPEGWILMGPMEIQRWAPKADCPTNITAISMMRLKM